MLHLRQSDWQQMGNVFESAASRFFRRVSSRWKFRIFGWLSPWRSKRRRMGRFQFRTKIWHWFVFLSHQTDPAVGKANFPFDFYLLKQRRPGWTRFEEILLPTYDVDACRSDWETAQLQHRGCRRWRCLMNALQYTIGLSWVCLVYYQFGVRESMSNFGDDARLHTHCIFATECDDSMHA